MADHRFDRRPVGADGQATIIAGLREGLEAAVIVVLRALIAAGTLTSTVIWALRHARTHQSAGRHALIRVGWRWAMIGWWIGGSMS